MQRTLLISVLALGLVALFGGGCLEDKVLELVFTGETYADFSENETSADNPEIAVVDVAEKIREILDDNGYTTDDLTGAHVTSVSYGVTQFSQAHDWVLTGQIRVSRDGGAYEVIVDYASQSVQAALGQKIPANLNQAGVDLINTALDDFINNNANPVLTFQVEHGTIAPSTPTPGDPMIFEWRAWLAVQLIAEQTVEVPDPF
jgi:hypothetical protein